MGRRVRSPRPQSTARASRSCAGHDRVYRDSKYVRWIARSATTSTRNRTNPPAMTEAGSGAIKRTIGPNPTTFARATAQAHSCRRRIPSPVPKATIAANPLRKAWPAASKWAHNIERSTTTIQAAAGHVGLLGPGSNEAVKRESRIARAAAKAKTQYGAPENEPY